MKVLRKGLVLVGQAFSAGHAIMNDTGSWRKMALRCFRVPLLGFRRELC